MPRRAREGWAAEPKLIKGEVNAEVTTQEHYDDGPSQNTCPTAAKVTASSTLKPEGKNSYGAEHLVDGKLKSAWSEGAQDTGLGTTLTFKVGPPDTSRPSFEGIFHVFNGYAASEVLWKKNARVKKLKVTLNGKPLFREKRVKNGPTLAAMWGSGQVAEEFPLSARRAPQPLN